MVSTFLLDHEHQVWAKSRLRRVRSGPSVHAPLRADRLGGLLDTRDNALNFLRLVLAWMVLFGHTWWTGGFGSHATIFFGPMAVDGFFALSGFLIMGSRMRSSAWAYLRARCLRILPAFWVNLLVTAFVFAPLAAFVERGAWFSAASALGYVARNAMLRMWVFGIDGTLVATPLPNVWNGSLWTLFYEFSAYLVSGALLSFALLRRTSRWWLPCLTVMVVAAYAVASGPAGVTEALVLQTLQLGGFFLAGMCAWAWRDRLPLHRLLALGSAVVLVLLFLRLDDRLFNTVAPVPLCYLLLYLGARLPVRVGVRNDISYGVYIYAYPIQQLVSASGLNVRLGFVGTFVLVSVVTTGLAWASWVAVERPALRLKSGGEGRPRWRRLAQGTARIR
jgi:Predicted acyltransferases